MRASKQKTKKLRHILKKFSLNEINFSSTLSFEIRVSLFIYLNTCHYFSPKALLCLVHKTETCLTPVAIPLHVFRSPRTKCCCFVVWQTKMHSVCENKMTRYLVIKGFHSINDGLTAQVLIIGKQHCMSLMC